MRVHSREETQCADWMAEKLCQLIGFCGESYKLSSATFDYLGDLLFSLEYMRKYLASESNAVSLLIVPNLELKHWHENCETAKYDLFSVVLHVGGSTGGGHYHAYIKDPYGTISETNNDSTSASELNGSNKCRVPTGSSAVCLLYRCIDTFGSYVSRALLSKAPSNLRLDTASVLAAYMRQSLATDAHSSEVNRDRLKTSDSVEHGKPKINQNQRGTYRPGQDMRNKKGIPDLSNIHFPLRQNISKAKMTDAVSIRRVQPLDVKKLNNVRSRPAHRDSGNLKPASRRRCNKHNTLVTPCSVQSKSRNSPTLTDCGAYSTGLLSEGSISHTLPALQAAQHNSALGRHTSSHSSSSSTSPSPIAHRGMESLHSSTAHRSSSPLWHSKLFDGSPSLEAQGSHSTSRINTSKTDSDLGRHCTHRAQKANERIMYLDSQPPGYGSLDAIPFMQRTKGQDLPQMSVPVGSIRDTTHLKAIHYSSLEEQSSCHLECQHIPVDEAQRTPEKNGRSVLSAQLDTENLRLNTVSERNLPDVRVGRWFDINDDCITEVDPESFQRVFEGPECAYMLFYRLMGLAMPVNPITQNN
ncbi:hypothetical protein T265_11128 [Opisthorchis viverrini]|uniref:Peptidase C19 ubiquitin carboxyl-terminal hydrolase domain-containing protein n=1 Tax=Opisthorchis viverrini TaxID=6198 RepID=A0A074ZAN3_OPIVI|nr:hypothetical protein T265_11128 [Opisthorchis viverrini]KER20285.1 hypothetical protein T265_11128 [Opisthorchis viverrini]